MKVYRPWWTRLLHYQPESAAHGLLIGGCVPLSSCAMVPDANSVAAEARNGALLHVDHVIPWSKGGETTLENLRVLCSVCNIGKSDVEQDAGE